MYHYSFDDIVYALQKVGLSRGDCVFTHSNVGFFGVLKDARNPTDYYILFKHAMEEVIGQEGTWIVPTFSYSFCKGEFFSSLTTPSVCGILAEGLRKDPQAVRSCDPNFSVAAIGAQSEYFARNASSHSFGKNSFWERFLLGEGIICNFNLDSACTFLHYIEREEKVPYRYDKAFTGELSCNGKKRKATFYHYVFDHDKIDDAPNFPNFDRLARANGYVKVADLGRGQVISISAKDSAACVRVGLQQNSFFFTKRYHYH